VVAPADTGMLSVAKPKKKKITHIAQLQSNDLIWYRRAILGHYISMELMSDVQQQQCKEGDLFLYWIHPNSLLHTECTQMGCRVPFKGDRATELKDFSLGEK